MQVVEMLQGRVESYFFFNLLVHVATLSFSSESFIIELLTLNNNSMVR